MTDRYFCNMTNEKATQDVKATPAISNLILNLVGWNIWPQRKQQTEKNSIVLLDLIPSISNWYIRRNENLSHSFNSDRLPLLTQSPCLKAEKKFTKSSFFPSTIWSWSSLNSQCREAHTKSKFSTLINNMYDCKKRLFLHYF